jgi:hypothetical protein
MLGDRSGNRLIGQRQHHHLAGHAPVRRRQLAELLGERPRILGVLIDQLHLVAAGDHPAADPPAHVARPDDRDSHRAPPLGRRVPAAGAPEQGRAIRRHDPAVTVRILGDSSVSVTASPGLDSSDG